MAREIRTHVGEKLGKPSLAHSSFTPEHITKQQFGRRVYVKMTEKGWSQSDLSRQSGILRDAISKYINGKVLPTPPRLEKLARALGLKPEELLPNYTEAAIGADRLTFDMKVSDSAPGMAWVRVDRLCRIATALKIAELLDGDDVLERAREARK